VWLKIIFPLMSLALLSTVFLLSRSVDPTKTIPFAKIDLKERARDQRITAPHFSGASEAGDLLTFTADFARPDPEVSNRVVVQNLATKIQLINGTLITFSSISGVIDVPADEVVLDGNVVIHSSTNYTVRTETLTTGMREVRAETAGQVEAVGPVGRFTAGKMLLTSDPDTGATHLIFTNEVKLVYDPKQATQIPEE
jgi:lipopolysaccharide export system protein LptC